MSTQQNNGDHFGNGKDKADGTITRIIGPIVEVDFSGAEEIPDIYNALEVLPEKGSAFERSGLTLEVQSHIGERKVRAIAMDSVNGLRRGMYVRNRKKPIEFPVGRDVLGHMFTPLGRQIDYDSNAKDGGLISGQLAMEPVVKEPPQYGSLTDEDVVLRTGIKVVDLMAPIIEGGKVGLFGGAGVGKTVFLRELMHCFDDIAKPQKDASSKERTVTIYGGIGERTREGNDLWVEFHEDNAKQMLKNTAFVFGQMNEPPGSRFRAGHAAITLAEHFRDPQQGEGASDTETGKRKVLLFLDNIFRYIQAGSELSTLLDRMPSAVGYQPTLEMELGDLQERISSTTKGSITAIEAVYVPADDLTDPAPMAIFGHLDAKVVLKREIADKGYYPAVDALESESRALNITRLTKEDLLNSDAPNRKGLTGDMITQLISPEKNVNYHQIVANKVREILEGHRKLDPMVKMLGLKELREEDQKLYRRGELIQRMFTQPFKAADNNVAEEHARVSMPDIVFTFMYLAYDDAMLGYVDGGSTENGANVTSDSFKMKGSIFTVTASDGTLLPNLQEAQLKETFDALLHKIDQEVR